LIYYDVCVLHVGYDVGVGINGASNWALQVLKIDKESFQQFIKVSHASNVAEMNIPFLLESKLLQFNDLYFASACSFKYCDEARLFEEMPVATPTTFRQRSIKVELNVLQPPGTFLFHEC
jgi:hypothetical protein